MLGPAAVEQEVVSANDERPRDPCDWTVLGFAGEAEEEKEVVLHRVAGAEFPRRHQANQYSVEERKPARAITFRFEKIFDSSAAISIQVCMLILPFASSS